MILAGARSRVNNKQKRIEFNQRTSTEKTGSSETLEDDSEAIESRRRCPLRCFSHASWHAQPGLSCDCVRQPLSHPAHLSRGMSSSAGTACTDAEEDAEDVENDVAGTRRAQSLRYLSSSSSSLSRIRNRSRASDHLEGLRLDGSSVVHPSTSDDTSGITVEDSDRPSTPWARG